MINEKPLSTEQRNNLKDSEFGIPELRAYPLNDKSHVEQAVRMFNYVDKEHEKELADNLNKAIKKFGLSIEVGDNNKFKKYVKESKHMNREQNINSILKSLNESTTINEESRDMKSYYADTFKKLNKDIDVISYDPGRIGSNTSTLVLQDKKSKNYFVYNMGGTGYVTSIALVETPDSNKRIISHYISGIHEDEEAVKFIVATRNYKKYAKSYDTMKAELTKLYKAYADAKALDPDGAFQNNDSKRGLFKALNTFFNDAGTKNYL